MEEVNYYYNHNNLITPVFAKTDSIVYIYQNSSIQDPDNVLYKNLFYNNRLVLEWDKQFFKRFNDFKLPKFDYFKSYVIDFNKKEIYLIEHLIDIVSYSPDTVENRLFLEQVLDTPEIKLVDFRKNMFYFELIDNQIDSLTYNKIEEYKSLIR